MTIADIEKAIIERLKAKVQGVVIEGFPEKPSQYHLTHAVGALLVRYSSSTYTEPHTTDLIVQERKVEFEIIVVMRHLREHNGAYAYLDAVRIALTGYKIPGCSKMYPVKEVFLSEDNGIWQYSITFTMTMPAIEVPEDEQLPVLKKIITEDDYGETITERR